MLSGGAREHQDKCLGAPDLLEKRDNELEKSYAYARMKTDNTSCDSTSFVMPNSSDIDVRAGATIDDEIGDIRVKLDTMIVAAHFLTWILESASLLEEKCRR